MVLNCLYTYVFPPLTCEIFEGSKYVLVTFVTYFQQRVLPTLAQSKCSINNLQVNKLSDQILSLLALITFSDMFELIALLLYSLSKGYIVISVIYSQLMVVTDLSSLHVPCFDYCS